VGMSRGSEQLYAVRRLTGEPPSERSSEVSRMSEEEFAKFAKTVSSVIRNSAEVRQAIWDCACQCPNLVVEY